MDPLSLELEAEPGTGTGAVRWHWLIRADAGQVLVGGSVYGCGAWTALEFAASRALLLAIDLDSTEYAPRP